MKLSFKKYYVLNEGGNVFKDANKLSLTVRIQKADIDPTVKFIESITSLPLIRNYLGSTGKKSSSGDLDLAVDENTTTKDQLVEKLSKWVTINLDGKPVDYIRKGGIEVHFKTPIKGNADNGYVQTDFMFSKNIKLLKFIYKGSGIEDSPYKGNHRNILMASISRALTPSYKFSTTRGLLDSNDQLVADDPAEIVQILGGPGTQESDFDTVESILNIIQKRPDYEKLVLNTRTNPVYVKSGVQLP